jgi:hypothetical protein
MIVTNLSFSLEWFKAAHKYWYCPQIRERGFSHEIWKADILQAGV